MTASPSHHTPPSGPGPDRDAAAALPATTIPPELFASAGSRLVSAAVGDLDAAGRRFVAAAPEHGIDLALLRGTIAPAAPRVPARVRQCCLPVPGAGRTAMLFLSSPGEIRHCGPHAVQHAERLSSIHAALDALAALPTPPRLAQALPEPGESAMLHACQDAGFTTVGTLDYLARPFPRAGEWETPTLPQGITIEPVSALGPAGDDILIQTLEKTYVGTQDCPALCGLRDTRDILDSHRASGTHNPDHWILIRDHGTPTGCVLLAHIPHTPALELAYLGLAPTLRGRGLAAPLMRLAVRRLAHLRAEEITCAVDRANAPAVRLYRGLGFRPSGTRTALVRTLGAP